MLRPLTFLAIGIAFLATSATAEDRGDDSKLRGHDIDNERDSFNDWSRHESNDITKLMATKTVYYDQTKGNHRLLAQAHAEDYSLLQIQQVVRHGTRFPTAGNAGEIAALVSKLQTNFADKIPAWLQGYKLPYNASVDGFLASTGFTELRDLGERTRNKVGDAIPGTFSSDKFLLQHTYKPRTKDSAKSFASTFFSNPIDVSYLEYPKKTDKLLRFFDLCPRYTRDVADNPATLAEHTAFMETKKMLKTIDVLRKKLKLSKTADITIADVQSVYAACAFDLALYGIHDNWCTLLTKESIQNIEYADELDTFYNAGPGFPINYEMSAILLQDIVKSMKDFLAGTSQLVGNFRFVHGETTLPLMTLLGYVDMTPLGADWRDDAIDSRHFRTSRLALFMANLEFGLYRKTRGKNQGDVYVQIRINEKVTEIPGCRGKVFCKLDKFEQIYARYLTQYDFATACAI